MDDIASRGLKNVPHEGIRFLPSRIHSCVRLQYVLNIWKLAKVISVSSDRLTSLSKICVRLFKSQLLKPMSEKNRLFEMNIFVSEVSVILHKRQRQI